MGGTAGSTRVFELWRRSGQAARHGDSINLTFRFVLLPDGEQSIRRSRYGRASIGEPATCSPTLDDGVRFQATWTVKAQSFTEPRDPLAQGPLGRQRGERVVRPEGTGAPRWIETYHGPLQLLWLEACTTVPPRSAIAIARPRRRKH